MGQRANLITVENGGYTVRYDHWCANRLDKILFWGVGYALDFFDAQEEVGNEGWLDDVWAEGGAVLDLDKKHLLWWGGEDIMYELPLRRVYLKLQEKVWNGWTIEWAHRGIVDLAEYVGYPKENVLADREDLNEPVEVKLAEKPSWVMTLGSICSGAGEVRLFLLNYDCENYLSKGTSLISECLALKGLEKAVWNEWEENREFPQGGFWIDEKSKTVEFWSVRDCPNVVQDLKKIWDGWDIVWHQDEYEFQVEKLGSRIVLPEINESELFERLRQNLLREDGRTGLSAALDANELLKKEGADVQINPWLFKSHHVEQPLESKQKIWERNFGE
jgi:hypothetical protein